MKSFVNPGKQKRIFSDGTVYERYAVKTHFVNIGEQLLPIMEQYVRPIWQPGDFLAISEKVVALCQKRVVYRETICPGFWARLLCRFVAVTPAGPGAGTPHKMQLIIMLCGLFRVLLAALCAAVTRPLGIRGVFYRVCGHEVGSIDGLIDYDISFPAYYDYAILSPIEPGKVCRELEEKTGIPCVIADVCDVDVQILGKSTGVTQGEQRLRRILADNPAGQEDEQTPVILIRPIQPCA